MPNETAAQRSEREAAEKAAADKKAATEKAAADAANKNDNATTVDSGRSAPSTEAVTQDKPQPKEDPNATPQSYVWLVYGEVLRVNDEDLPGASGAANPHGHWQRENKVFEVVG